MAMPARRFNADKPLPPGIRASVEQLKREQRDARRHFMNVREQQLKEHRPRDGDDHTPAQRANATQMANKAVAMRFLGWP